MSATKADWAARYIDLGFAITWSPPGVKGPRHTGWKHKANAFTDAAAARKFFSRHPDFGMGAILEHSGRVSVDIDHTDHSRPIFRDYGMDLDELRQTVPCIEGKPGRFRMMFAAPKTEIWLRHRTLMYPKRENPAQGFAVFELRAGAISDALPPTIHVSTGKPYRWTNPPSQGFPPPPAPLLEMWQFWLETKRRALLLCPWAPPPVEPSKREWPKLAPLGPAESVIAAFNAAHDITQILEQHGYVRRDKRFASPDTSHEAGIVLLDGGRVFCHHQGDPLSSEFAHDAFDVYRLLEHNGDFRSAVKAAATALGMSRQVAA